MPRSPATGSAARPAPRRPAASTATRVGSSASRSTAPGCRFPRSASCWRTPARAAVPRRRGSASRSCARSSPTGEVGEMLKPGVLLGNRYRLDERIAGGGMGDVWRGTDEVLGRTVAVKILLPALLDEPGFAERFRGEARTMATINHPGVVDVYDYGSDQQLAFL